MQKWKNMYIKYKVNEAPKGDGGWNTGELWEGFLEGVNTYSSLILLVVISYRKALKKLS